MQREDIFFKKGGIKIASLSNGLCPFRKCSCKGNKYIAKRGNILSKGRQFYKDKES